MPQDPGDEHGQALVLKGNGDDVADLVCRFDGESFVSRWHLSLDERRAILDGADVVLFVARTAAGFPPVNLVVQGVQA